MLDCATAVNRILSAGNFYVMRNKGIIIIIKAGIHFVCVNKNPSTIMNSINGNFFRDINIPVWICGNFLKIIMFNHMFVMVFQTLKVDIFFTFFYIIICYWMLKTWNWMNSEDVNVSWQHHCLSITTISHHMLVLLFQSILQQKFLAEILYKWHPNECLSHTQRDVEPILI